MPRPEGLRKDPLSPEEEEPVFGFSLESLARRVSPGFDSGQFSSAYVMFKIHEDRMIPGETLEKMLEAESPEEALKLAAGSSFLESLGAAAPGDFETALSAEFAGLMDFLKSFAPEILLELFTLEPDFHNLKILLKMRLGALEDDELDALVHPRGFLDAKTIRELLKLDEFASVVKNLECYADIIDRLDPRQLDEKMSDTLLDHLMLEELARLGSGVSSELMSELVKIRSDFGNLRLFVRGLALGWKPDLLCPFFLGSGRIPARELTRVYSNQKKLEPREQFYVLEQLMGTAYKQLFPVGNISLEDRLVSGIREGFRELRESASLFSLEKLFDNLVVWKAVEAKSRLFTLDPIIAFALGKQGEIQNLRIVMTGKLNSLGPERIRSLLRESYIP